MKRSVILTCLFLCIGIISNGQQAKRFAIKSGYLKTELSGSTSGVKELWWDDYGEKTTELEKSVTVTKIFGIKNKEENHTLTIMVHDKFWSVNYTEDIATTGNVIGYRESKEMMDAMTEAERETFANSVLEGFGGKRLGEEKVNGYTCEVFEVMGIKSWIHKGLTLKTEGKVLGQVMNESIAVFEPGKNVIASKFSPPKGVEFESLASQSGEAGEMMSALFGDLDEEMEEDDDEEVIPVTYPFSKFEKVINEFHPGGYVSGSCRSMFGMHSASFSGAKGNLLIVAQSAKNVDIDEEVMREENLDMFNYHGHTCYYGKVDEEEGVVLIIEYPEEDMVIVITSLPGEEKETMLGYSDELDF